MKTIRVNTSVPATVTEVWTITVPDDYDLDQIEGEREMTRLISNHHFTTKITEVDADSDDLTVWHAEEVHP